MPEFFPTPVTRPPCPHGRISVLQLRQNQILTILKIYPNPGSDKTILSSLYPGKQGLHNFLKIYLLIR